MTLLKNISFKIFISITIIISALAIECPTGFDSVPPGRPFGICVILGCARPVKDQLCTVDCVQGYTKTSDKKCQVTKCISNSKSACSACQAGFQLKAQSSNPILRICVPSNCLSFDATTRECKVCQKGFILDNKKGTCGLANCLQPSRDQTQCSTCKQGYTITLVAEGIGLCAPKNCQIYSPSTYQCNICQPSYILTESSSCKLGIQNCTQFNEFSGLCYKCQKGFKLMGLRNCVKQSPFCLSYGNNGCTLCQYPYRALSGDCLPNFCEQFSKNNKSQCSKCQIGFNLNSKKLCQVQNCETFDQKVPKCTKCTGMYDLTSVESAVFENYVVQKCLSKYCVKFDKKTSLCLECNPQFTLKDGSCVFSNCNKMGYSNCQECVDGWVQNERGNCVNFDCLEFNDINSCKSCRTEKRLYKGTCIKDNCVMRNPDTKKCLQCSIQYLIHPKFDQYCVVPFCAKIDESTGDCLECYPNFKFNSKNFCESAACLNYETKKQLINPQCSSCIQGYQPENEYCVGSKKYCAEYSLEEGRCKKCALRYELSTDNLTCNPMKCKQLTKKSTFSLCQVCNLGYSVINYENGTQSCEPSNCTKLQNFLCKQCVKGFSLLLDICLTDNCKSFMQNSGLCQECLDGFYLNTSLYTCSREKCLQQTKDTCNKCIGGYYVDTNDNSQTKGLCVPYNCEVVNFQKRDEKSSSIKCQKCKNDFILMPNEKCWVKDCNQVDESTGFCNECLVGFNLMKDGKCYINRNNDYCPDRSYPDDKFSCRPMKAKNCISANPKNTSQCYKCQQNFYLNSGTCRSFVGCAEKNLYLGCLRCELGYKINSNQECENTFPNCQTYDQKTAQCQQCSIGYQIILYPNKKCMTIPDFCALMDPWGNCTQCRLPNRVLNGGSCIIPTNNCVKYDSTSGLCLNCNQGYYKKADNGNPSCIKNPDNCETVSQKGECTKCADNFIFTNGGCYNKIDKCVYYSFQKCTLCQSGYFVDSTGMNCRELPKYCDKVILNTDGICEKCTNRFANVNGRCVRMIDYCDNYQLTTGKCLACQSGYSLTSSKQICLFGIV